MNLQSNDFELFGVPERFAQDRAALDARWKELQKEAHPDKFAAQGVAAHLCELHGAPIQAHDNTAMPPAFLMQQMEWREALEDASTPAAVDALEDEVMQARKAGLAQCEALIDQQGDYPAAAQQVRALMFIARFADDIDRRREQLGQ